MSPAKVVKDLGLGRGFGHAATGGGGHDDCDTTTTMYCSAVHQSSNALAVATLTRDIPGLFKKLEEVNLPTILRAPRHAARCRCHSRAKTSPSVRLPHKDACARPIQSRSRPILTLCR